jgi:hypothetical protein
MAHVLNVHHPILRDRSRRPRSVRRPTACRQLKSSRSCPASSRSRRRSSKLTRSKCGTRLAHTRPVAVSGSPSRERGKRSSRRRRSNRRRSCSIVSIPGPFTARITSSSRLTRSSSLQTRSFPRKPTLIPRRRRLIRLPSRTRSKVPLPSRRAVPKSPRGRSSVLRGAALVGGRASLPTRANAVRSHCRTTGTLSKSG